MIEDMKINQKQREQYIEKGYWTHTSLLDCWNHTVRLHGDREYVVDDRGHRYTYAQMDKLAAAAAAYLQFVGVQRGDRVSFQIPVWSEFVIVVIACLKAGAVLHPIAMCYEEEELVYAMNQTKPKVYLGPTWFHKSDYEARIESVRDRIPSLADVILLDNLREKRNDWKTLKEILAENRPMPKAVQTDGFDLALLLGTSGTTGGSKGVMLTHNNIIFSEKQFNKELGLSKDDIMFMPAPLNHATGFHHGLMAPMLMGAKVVLQQKFKCSDAIDLMNRERCTYSMGSTPFIYDILNAMEKEHKQLPHLKFYLCGGAPVPGYMVQKANTYGIKLCEVYGSTESVPHVYVHPDEALALNGTTSGRPLEGIEVKIVDDHGNIVPYGTAGEEASRGPNVFVGYIRNKEATDKVLDDEGWFYSGDICVEDENGNIRVIGRKKDLIVRGGENLNTNEIDSYLEGCPGVCAHTVIGMPDERLGERICAYVVLEDGIETLTLKQLTGYLADKKIPKRFWPERLEIIDRIPLTPSGKVKKYLLTKHLEERRPHD